MLAQRSDSFGGWASSSHSASSASAFGYQVEAPTLIPGPSPAMLYISHKSTYGQRYLSSPPSPLSRTAGEGAGG